MPAPRVAAILIGRNEGPRLVAALAALPPDVAPVIYVDSGSTDGSVAAARAAGARVVALDMTRPFTAARARNEGFAALAPDRPDYVQFIDGDCTLVPGWIETATAFLDAHPAAAVACGRRRERFPEASVWNRLCDAEWDTPVGRATACGGDALMRTAAFAAAGGYNPGLIAGEEPELCVRLRAAGWEIWRLDAEMTLHDAAMTRFRQWWKRTRRAGHAFAEGAAIHGRPPERHFVTETRRAVIWGAALPLAALAGAVMSPWALLLLLLYPVQILRLAPRMGLTRATFLTLGKLPEAVGVAEYWFGRLSGRRAGLIEYK
ncbi:glycosyltransferase family 2 protein [Paragemmobacter ruber]|uniref:Glycosyltransferase n=1 Tax=Paragemmobacter ruber TaxID=1985673 RepID=A0ABW9Y219_9RHOB|nr:glycosyltransferase [Rhodobacter ruber]NBE06555.1 glycosyltransferase [Rhodobacter ruber]